MMAGPQHHPSDATLLAYSSGNLSQGFALTVSTHLGFCTECRQRSGEMEQIGGALLEDMPPAPMAGAAWDKVLARLDDTPAPTVAPARSPETAAWPSELADYLPGPSLPWRPLVPGVRHVPLAVAMPKRGNVRLVRIAPDKAVGEHGHTGREMTVVLEGGFSDVLGHYGAGDFMELDEGVEHEPVTPPGTHCVCLIAVESPLRFRGLLARLLQPILGL
jgi:putative transcriptional regulator